MFVKSLSSFAGLIALLFVLENGFCQVKQELPSELLPLAGMLSKPLPELNSSIEAPIKSSDVPALTFRNYEIGFFKLKRPDSTYLFGSAIQKMMISIVEDSIVNGVFVTLNKNDLFWLTAFEKLGAESGKWKFESNFGSSDDYPESPDHIWNIAGYIIVIFNSNDYDGTPAEDKDKYVLALRRKVNI